ncbi:MAG: DNA repair protein RadA [Alphaproteobacteria bacterium]|nr:DNA repair protein RadA [Alphaproteobacteria bacterium]
MPRSDTVYVCQSCGTVHAKWAGRCDACGSWNTLVEEAGGSAPLGGGAKASPARSGRRSKLELVDLGSDTEDPQRFETGIAELDRVAGGGLVPGSAVLVGGDPGIGKSTLLLQAVARLALSGAKAVYVSGEEAADQVRRRARRLGLADAPVALAAETSLEVILDGLKKETPDVAIIDSIQTLWSDQLAAAPGTVAQVRACAQELVRFAKKRNTAVILVGHVTKDGQIAGPRVVEHMVDAVLYFEGERSHQFRILRAVKNRFGPTDEIGVFEMADAGLQEVANPSALFLDGRGEAASGAAVFAGMEGTRPVLTEIQALVAPAAFGTPRRAVVGWDSGRLAMVLAVLEARCGLGFGGRDVYLNVAGGLKIGEPAADLAVAAALISSYLDAPLPSDGVAFGEISLSGDVRPVGRSDARLKEAAKLGFKRALAPAGVDGAGLKMDGVDTVQALVRRLGQDAD